MLSRLEGVIMCVVEILIAHAAVVFPERKRMYTVRDRQRERDFVSSHTPVLYSFL